MSTYFFDTSALVKRYHREIGTEIVDAAFDDKNATKIISDISVIEFYSAFAKKVCSLRFALVARIPRRVSS